MQGRYGASSPTSAGNCHIAMNTISNSAAPDAQDSSMLHGACYMAHAHCDQSASQRKKQQQLQRVHTCSATVLYSACTASRFAGTSLASSMSFAAGTIS